MLAYPMTIVAYSIDVLPKKPMCEVFNIALNATKNIFTTVSGKWTQIAECL